MSAVCAVFDTARDGSRRSLLERMLDAAAHRGREARGVWVGDGVGLGALVLAATPEALGEHQPEVADGGRLVVAADARLDNRAELLGRLGGGLTGEAPGAAALILAAYRRWGPGCVEELVGDFAFVVWDGRRRTLLAARDPLGVKSLCYARLGSVVLLASEPQQLLAYPFVPRGLDEEAVARFLVDGTSGDRTLLAAVRRLPPAHRLLVDGRKERCERYWSLPDGGGAGLSDEEHVEAFATLFSEAVACRLRRPGGPVGLTLSGGLDSSSVAVVAGRALAREGAQGVGYTLRFPTLSACDEGRYSGALARQEGLVLDPLDAEALWPLGDLATHPPSLGDPFVGWPATREITRRLAARGGRVLLTGHGGDNLLSGSSRVYAEALLRGRPGGLVDLVRHGRCGAVDLPRLLYRHLFRPLAPAAADRTLRRLLDRPALGTAPPAWLPRRLATQLPGRTERSRSARQEIRRQLLELEPVQRAVAFHERTAAGHGVEVRHPFLDRRLVEHVATLPPPLLYRAGERKWVLRQAMRDLLPEPVRCRSDKAQFGSYVDAALRHGAAEHIDGLLAAPLLAALGFVDGRALSAAWGRYRASGEGAREPLVFAILLESWLRRHGETLGLLGAQCAA